MAQVWVAIAPRQLHSTIQLINIDSLCLTTFTNIPSNKTEMIPRKEGPHPTQQYKLAQGVLLSSIVDKIRRVFESCKSFYSS